jgi:hypothetical protein
MRKIILVGVVAAASIIAFGSEPASAWGCGSYGYSGYRYSGYGPMYRPRLGYARSYSYGYIGGPRLYRGGLYRGGLYRGGVRRAWRR